MSQHAKDAQYSVSASSEIASWDAEERLIFATRAQAEATLALAYEQRTANLIAVFAEGGLDIGADYEAVGESLLERLGLA